MPHWYRFFKYLVALIRRENFHKIALIVIVVIVLGAEGFSYFEPNTSFTDALWWSVVTATTVGYGDISPATPGGRIIGAVVMLLGIGVVGLMTATIAGFVIEQRVLARKGKKGVAVKGHYIICGWNFEGHSLLAELRADAKAKDAPIVVIALCEESPESNDPAFHFIHGEVDRETLEKACAADAVTAIILGDVNLEPYSRDAKCILTTLSIKKLYPQLYVCVELMDAKNVGHCQTAGADEVVILGELGTNLLAQAALDHGITRMITDLVSNRTGDEIFKVPPPPGCAGKTFIEVLMELKQQHNVICVGLETAKDGALLTNPDASLTIGDEDYLIVIASDRPDWTRPAGR